MTHEFRAFDKDKKRYLLLENRERIFINMDGRVLWFLGSDFDDETEHIEIEFFTGLTDKNGKKIFEGDKTRGKSYIQTDGKYTSFEGVIEWSDQYAGFYVRGKTDEGRDIYLSFEYIILADIEVIDDKES